MNAIFIIAENTFRELVRDKILYGILVFAALLFGLSLVLGQLTFAEQARISSDFGFSAIQISAAILAMFVGGTLVRREIEKKTIFTLLARPIHRVQFLIGKSLGLLLVVLMSVLLLAFVLALILAPMGVYPDELFLLALYGVLLESAVLLAFTIFFGIFTSPMLAVSFVVAVFIIGHSIDSLKFFINKSSSDSFQLIGQLIISITPNLEIFNWRSLFVYQEALPLQQVLIASSYAIAWCLFLVSISAVIFNRKDLG